MTLYRSLRRTAASTRVREETLNDRSPIASRDRGRFRSDIQGLRAVAVMMVLLYHAGVPFFAGGYVGVDVFFVISGFLITGHLYSGLRQQGRVAFREFYARRVRRILPASIVVVIMTTVSAIVVFPPLVWPRVFRDAIATSLYVPNILFAKEGTDYLSEKSPSVFQHYWSLGVEEQFYLLWPLVLVTIMFLVRRRTELFITAIFLLLGAGLLASVLTTFDSQPTAFFMVHTRAWEFLAGGLVAVLFSRPTLVIAPGLASLLRVVGVSGLVASALTFSEETPFPGFAALLPVLSTLLLIFAGSVGQADAVTRALSSRGFQWVGLISYSLYLVHWPLLVLTQEAVGPQHTLSWPWKVLIGIVAAMPLAWLLYRFVESPLRTGARASKLSSGRVLLTVGAVTAVIVVALAGGRELLGNTRVDVGPAMPFTIGEEVLPLGADQLPANASPNLAAIGADLPAMYARGCQQDLNQERVEACHFGAQDGTESVVLFGDSHSAQWLPATQGIAETDSSLSISTYTKSSCPAVDVLVTSLRKPYESCQRWRAGVMEHLVSDPVDLVIISSYSGYELFGVAPSRADREWSEGLQRTVRALKAVGTAVLVIADTPKFGYSPPECVSGNSTDLRQCAGTRETVIDRSHLEVERQAVGEAGGWLLDLTDYLCNDATCPVVIGSTVVYRDVNHLTTEASAGLSGRLKPDLERLLDLEGAVR